MTDWNLSDKRHQLDEYYIEDYHYEECDVKEFIKRLKEELGVFHMGTLYEGKSIWEIMGKKIDKLAGDKLIKFKEAKEE